MFRAVFFTTAKTWKEQRCPSVGKLWYIWKMEYYTMLKRNELSTHEKTWSNLICILLGEISQYVKATYCVIPTI